jgi:hypothetical protein
MVAIPCCLTYPGRGIDLPDPSVARDIDSLLHLLGGTLIEAAISLGAYIDCRNMHVSTVTHEQWRQNMDQQNAYQESVRAEWGINKFDFSRHAEVRAEADRRRLKDFFASGRLPQGYVNEMPRVHAKGFLTSAYLVRTVLKLCTEFDAIKAKAELAIAAIDATLPDLKGVRDSATHVDERELRRAGKKPILPQGGFMLIGNLNYIGDKFFNTLRDGTHGEVPVTVEAFDLLVKVTQDFFDALPWQGDPEVEPTP